MGWCTAIIGLVALFGACATQPEVGHVMHKPAPAGSGTDIVDSRGPLSAKESQAIIDKVKAEAKDSGMLERHLAIEEAVAGSPLVADNRVTLLPDAETTFKAMAAAIRGAKHHINLEYYILEDVELDGTRLSELLRQKRGEGVAVSIIYDSVGSIETPAEFFDGLRDAGVRLLEYNPINPMDAKDDYALNERNHRKILVVDGRLGIVGGVNLSSSYGSLPSSGSRSREGGVPPAEGDQDYWRDSDLMIEGPAVHELQKLFVEHWHSEQQGPLDVAGFYPEPQPRGDELVRIVGTSPEEEISRYYATLLSAIRTAEKSILLTTAYFVPTDEERDDLAAAAQRGVDVRLLLPGKSDAPLAVAMGHNAYDCLLEAGVRIFESQHEILHSKTVVIDGVWSAVGSSNFDQRSAVFNHEVDAVVIGRDTAAALEKLFAEQAAKATEITLAQWRQRSIAQRVNEKLLILWERYF